MKANHKNQWLERLLGISSQRDEYQIQGIKNLLTKMALILWFSDMLLLLILIVTDTIKKEISFATIWLVVVNFLVAIYVYVKMRQLGLNVTEVENEADLQVYKKRAIRTAIFQGVSMTLLVFVAIGVILPLILGETFSFSWSDLLKLIVFGFLLTSVILYGLALLKIKKYEESAEDEEEK